MKLRAGVKTQPHGHYQQLAYGHIVPETHLDLGLGKGDGLGFLGKSGLGTASAASGSREGEGPRRNQKCGGRAAGE